MRLFQMCFSREMDDCCSGWGFIYLKGFLGVTTSCVIYKMKKMGQFLIKVA